MPYKKLASLEENKAYQNYEVTFLNQCQNYCVGMVDIVDSTTTSIRLSEQKLGKYYEIFLNNMAQIIERFNGIVIKNIGDSLLYYFPELPELENNYDFTNCLKCSISIMEQHESINKKMQKEGLPPLNYRVSSDYGSVKIMKINNSSSIDIIGKAVNFCTKINRCAPKNKAVIGSEMYLMVKDFDKYDFELMAAESGRLKYVYPVYLVHKR